MTLSSWSAASRLPHVSLAQHVDPRRRLAGAAGGGAAAEGCYLQLGWGCSFLVPGLEQHCWEQAVRRAVMRGAYVLCGCHVLVALCVAFRVRDLTLGTLHCH